MAHTRQIIVDGDTANIELTQGKWAIIDSDDVDRVRLHSWYYHESTGMVRSKIQGQIVYLHRFITGANDRGQIVDHLNGNTLDNRKANLHLGNYATNRRNIAKIPSSFSAYRGLHFHRNKSKVWELYPQIGGKSISLGYYSNPDEPARLFDCIQVRIARALGINVSPRSLNFPDDLTETLTSGDSLLSQSLTANQLDRLDSAIAHLSTKASDPTTWVYLAQRQDGAIKIGFSRDVDARLAAIRSGSNCVGYCPQTRLIDKFAFPNETVAARVERLLHQRFAHKRVRGEWFNLDDQDLDSVVNIILSMA